MARADRLENDDRILRAAAEVLGADPGASMQAVADAAGVSRLSVYRRYPDRDALLSALRTAVDLELNRSLDALPDWSDGGLTLEELVRVLARVAGRFPVALLRYAPVPGAEPAADARIVELLRTGQHAGALRADVPPESLNAALFGVLSALLTTEQAPDADHVAQLVSTLLLPGFTLSKGSR